MWNWLKAFAPPRTPLHGSPQRRRIKTYSADTGRVYQYVYEGFRRGNDGQEYVFAVTADRKNYVPVSVRVTAAATPPDLTPTERYAVAKLTLLRALDHRGLEQISEPIQPGSEEVGDILRQLDLAG